MRISARSLDRGGYGCPLQTSPRPERELGRTDATEGGHFNATSEEAYVRKRSSRSSASAELEIAKGRTAAEAAKKIGVTEQTYYRWRKEYGGLRTDQAKRLKELEKENARLKRLVADAELDKAILREAASGNF